METKDIKKTKNKVISSRVLFLLWALGMAGQICWNIENQWFNTFIYENIAPNSEIVNWMVGISAVVTTFSTFLFGTWSDRNATRKPLVSIGYILWGVFTIVFGLTSFLSAAVKSIVVVAIIVIAADAIMSFFGSMGNDSGFNSWVTDNLTHENQGLIGATMAAQPVLGTIIGTVIGGFLIASFGYIAFFAIMGCFVIIIGILNIFLMKDEKNKNPNKTGTFFEQFLKNFNFKNFFKMRELLFVNIIAAVFFIAFNVYFVHIGNLFIYNYGFSEDYSGYIQGVGLILAIIATIPASKLINKDKAPLSLFIAFIINIIGLLILWLFSSNCNVNNLFDSRNILLYIGVVMVGIGYVVTLQTVTVWGKSLYPSNSRGQFEGIRIVFFVLIPMIIGPAIANPIIKYTGKEITLVYATGSITGMAPTELLFLASAIVSLFAFIPLYFASKQYKERLKQKEEE